MRADSRPYPSCDRVKRFYRFRLGALAALALLASAAMPSRYADSVQQMATLRTARSAHTATTLASGEVLLAGGMANGGAGLAATELFDPATNAMREAGSLGEARMSHTATLLGDGSVLVAGGYNGDYLSSVEVYDPAARRFRAAGALKEGRSGHTATLLPDGRVLFAGGVGSGWTFLSSAELYDPRTGRSEAVGPMSVPRESHTATLLADGRVLVIGGHTGRRRDMEVHASAEVFSPAKRRFTTIGRLVTPRHKHDAVRLDDGRVLIVGGADRTDRVHFATTEIYHAGAGRFEPGPRMRYARYKIAGAAMLLRDGDVLVASGARTAEVLDVAKGAFRTVPGEFPAAYRFAAVARLADGGVLISGGYDDGNRNTGGVWRFSRQP